MEEATDSNAGAAGFNMRYAWLFGIALPVILYLAVRFV